jgi:hypothetical protein
VPANIIAAARIGNASANTISPTTPIVLAAGVALGKRVVVMSCVNISTTDPAQSVTDSRGNVYQVLADSNIGNSSRRVSVFVCKVTTALQIGDSIILTHAGQSPNRRTVTAVACDNISLLNTIIIAQGTGASTLACSSGATAARIDANSIIFGVAGNNQTVTGSSFAAGVNFTNGESLESGSGVTWRTLGTEWQIMTAGGTDAATGTWATAPGGWDMLAVVFQQLDAGDESSSAAETTPADPADAATVS